jgi:hypothetical protein
MILGPHVITRLRAATVIDPYSGEATQADWDDANNPPGESDIAGCSVQPANSQPILRNMRAGVVVDQLAWAPLGADVTEADRVRYADDVYSVSDTIQRWNFAPIGHLVIPLRLVRG